MLWPAPLFQSVATTPGHTTWTRTGVSASSPARVRVKPTVAAFAATDRVRRGARGAVLPALEGGREAAGTMAPSPAARIAGRAAGARRAGGPGGGGGRPSM